jgi:glyoxylase I family protein
MEPLDRFHHVALTVTDVDRSAEWYRRVLGMKEGFREESPGRRAVILAFAGGGMSVGVVEHAETDGAAFDPTMTGLDHLAFSVSSDDDLHGWAEHLDRHGVVHSGPISIPPGGILNFKDPDGVALSLFWDRS